MIDDNTVLGERAGNDGFAASVQSRIESEVRKARGSIGDSPFLASP